MSGRGIVILVYYVKMSEFKFINKMKIYLMCKTYFKTSEDVERMKTFLKSNFKTSHYFGNKYSAIILLKYEASKYEETLKLIMDFTNPKLIYTQKETSGEFINVMDINNEVCSICSKKLQDYPDDYEDDLGPVQYDVMESNSKFDKIKTAMINEKLMKEYLSKKKPQTNNIKIIDLKCQHLFHESCIYKAGEDEENEGLICPICKEITDGDLFNLYRVINNIEFSRKKMYIWNKPLSSYESYIRHLYNIRN